MAIFDVFKRKGTINGEIVLHGLPAHKMFNVTVTFFSVDTNSTPPPFNGDPPVESWTDTSSVKETEDPDDKPLRFSVRHVTGHYYIGVSVIAFIERDGKMFAQVERFFPMTQACEITAGARREIQLVVNWPDIPFDLLGSYGTIHPSKK
jgi:hypothetical protein